MLVADRTTVRARLSNPNSLQLRNEKDSCYSLDLRTRVVAAMETGMTGREAGNHFSIGESTALRWARRTRESGSPVAKPMGGKRPATQGSPVRLTKADPNDAKKASPRRVMPGCVAA